MDLIGLRFGRLTVVGRGTNRGSHARWVCTCDCGGQATVETGNLRSGNTRSCGCARFEHGHSPSTRPTPTYIAWGNMIQRTTNPNHPRWPDYGGRGIGVCARWLDFENFLADMGERPSAELSLDRIDNDGNYEPANCRWATRSTQQQNRRLTHV